MKYVKLCDVCEFINGDRGKNYPSSKDFVDKGIPFINAGHIQNNDISFENMNYISKEKFNKLGSGKVKKNDILYCLRGSLGKNAIVNIEEGAIASSLVILRSKTEDIDVNYLIKYLNSNYIKEQILKYNNGSSQPNLSAASVKNFNIYLPNYEKQKEISRILDKAQQLIDKRKEQIEALDELVKSKFIDMFGSPATNPKGWKVTTIGNITTDVRYGTSKPAVEGGKYPYLRMNNITYNGYLDLDNLKYIDIEDDELEKCIVRKGDVLFNRTNSAELIGKTCVFDLEEPMIIAGYIIRVRLINEVLPIYISMFLNSDFGKELLKGMAKGAVNQANINAQELKSIKIAIPPIEFQNQFADFVKQVDKLKFK